MLSKSRLFFYLNLIFILFIVFKYWQAPEKLLAEKDQLSQLQQEKVEFTAQICEEAKLTYKLRRLVLCLENKDRVLVTTPLYPEYNYGEIVTVQGRLQAPVDSDDFSYSAYLAKQNIYSVMYYPAITHAVSNINWRPPQELSANLNWRQRCYYQILKIKWFLYSKISKNLPDQEANLASAIILGYKNLIHPDDKEDFARSGLSHLIAISGAHITIITALLLNFLQNIGLKQKQAIRIILIFLSIYPILTGLSASALRASIMGILVLLAQRFERPTSSFNILLLAATLILALNPLALHDLGFQLSFASVFGIIYFQDISNYLQNRLRVKAKGILVKIYLNLSEALILTLVCQLAILPLLALNFKQISLVSILANPLLIWLFPYLLASLILALLLSSLIPVLSFYFFLPAYFCLNLLLKGARYFSSLPWAVHEFSNYQISSLISYYFFLVIAVYFLKKYWFKKLRKY